MKAALQAAWEALPLEVEGEATKRELTPEETTAIRESLLDQFPSWALTPKDAWSKKDFQRQSKAKRAFKKGEAEAPDVIIEQAQAALQAALDKAAMS